MPPVRPLLLLLPLLLLSACEMGTGPTAVTPPGPLSSGTEIVLQARPQHDAAGALLPPRPADLAAARAVLMRRLAALGKGQTSAVVQVQGDDQLVVRMPGGLAAGRTAVLLATTGHLELVDGGSSPLEVGSLICTSSGCPPDLLPQPGDVPAPSPLPLTSGKIYPVVIDGSQVDGSKVQLTSDPSTHTPMITFTLAGDGPQLLADFTGSHLDTYLPIVLDKVVLSSPLIRGKIPDGVAVISGLNAQEAEDLTIKLQSGALPVPLVVVSVGTFGTTPTPAK